MASYQQPRYDSESDGDYEYDDDYPNTVNYTPIRNTNAGASNAIALESRSSPNLFGETSRGCRLLVVTGLESVMVFSCAKSATDAA